MTTHEESEGRRHTVSYESNIILRYIWYKARYDFPLRKQNIRTSRNCHDLALKLLTWLSYCLHKCGKWRIRTFLLHLKATRLQILDIISNSSFSPVKCIRRLLKALCPSKDGLQFMKVHWRSSTCFRSLPENGLYLFGYYIWYLLLNIHEALSHQHWRSRLHMTVPLDQDEGHLWLQGHMWLYNPHSPEEFHFSLLQTSNRPLACMFPIITFMNKAFILKAYHRVLLDRATLFSSN